jgi:hypothetical protein
MFCFPQKAIKLHNFNFFSSYNTDFFHKQWTKIFSKASLMCYTLINKEMHQNLNTNPIIKKLNKQRFHKANCVLRPIRTLVLAMIYETLVN